MDSFSERAWAITIWSNTSSNYSSCFLYGYVPVLVAPLSSDSFYWTIVLWVGVLEATELSMHGWLHCSLEILLYLVHFWGIYHHKYLVLALADGANLLHQSRCGTGRRMLMSWELSLQRVLYDCHLCGTSKSALGSVIVRICLFAFVVTLNVCFCLIRICNPFHCCELANFSALNQYVGIVVCTVDWGWAEFTFEARLSCPGLLIAKLPCLWLKLFFILTTWIMTP